MLFNCLAISTEFVNEVLRQFFIDHTLITVRGKYSGQMAALFRSDTNLYQDLNGTGTWNHLFFVVYPFYPEKADYLVLGVYIPGVSVVI